MVSIVIPAYNVSAYIRQAVSFCINQTYTDIEIIVINDGSTDDTGSIIDELAAMDARIKVVHRKNHGLITTRMYGTQIAEGEYITYLDADDTLALDAVEKMMDKALQTESDIVVSNFYLYTDISEYVNESFSIRDAYTFSELMGDFFQRKIEFSVWGKLYRRALVIEALPFIDTSINQNEDYHFFSTIAKRAQIISGINKRVYGYYQRAGSMSKEKTIMWVRDEAKVALLLYENIVTLPDFGTLMPYFVKWAAERLVRYAKYNRLFTKEPHVLMLYRLCNAHRRLIQSPSEKIVIVNYTKNRVLFESALFVSRILRRITVSVGR